MSRYSAEELDSGYANYSVAIANGRVVRVFLDGIEQSNVITADEDQGFIVRHTLDANGKVQFDPLDRETVLTERLTGEVVIECKP